MNGQGLSVIDLFCGAGGLSEGFQQAGFCVRAGQDVDLVAGRTFALNHGSAKFCGGPIQDLSADSILEKAELASKETDVVVGGPPCQGYSVYNHKRGLSDPRSGLFKEYLRLIEGILPRWLVIENVTGIMSIENGAIIHEIKHGLKQLGYDCETKVLRAEEFGVPQERRRIFFVANRIGARFHFPKQTHYAAVQNLEESQSSTFVNIWDAISDLPELVNGSSSREVTYRTDAQSDYQRMLREGSVILTNHEASKLARVNQERMRFIPAGGSWRDLPVELLPEGMKRAKRTDHTKRYGRPRKNDLACTILTKCDVHWGAYIHPEQDRAFSVREAARLQSFPDRFTFLGSRTEQYVQVGNAVPPLLAKQIALSIRAADLETKIRDQALAA